MDAPKVKFFDSNMNVVTKEYEEWAAKVGDTVEVVDRHVTTMGEKNIRILVAVFYRQK